MSPMTELFENATNLRIDNIGANHSNGSSLLQQQVSNLTGVASPDEKNINNFPSTTQNTLNMFANKIVKKQAQNIRENEYHSEKVYATNSSLQALNHGINHNNRLNHTLDNINNASDARLIIDNKNNISDNYGQEWISTLLSWLQFPKVNNMTDIFGLGCSTAVIFGGLVPYIPQYLKIKQTKSSDGFSTYVCLTLLLANILRIFFYIGHPFELPLLFQSYVMIFGMLMMMEICVRIKRNASLYNITPINSINGTSSRFRTLNNSLDHETFWQWLNIFSYIKFLVLFTLMMGSLTYLLRDNSFYVELLGFVAVLTESMLGMPQIIRNYQKKSTSGMSVEMVIMWLSGDLFKTTYFFVRKTPPQFYVCGTIQVIVDILILSQVFWYRRPKVGYWRLPKSG